jgi:cell division transport system permease protein
MLRADLPLGADAAARFLPWIVGAMVYLAALALASAFAVNLAIGDWRADITGELTIEVPTGEASGPEARAARIDQVMAALAGVEGIAGLSIIGPAEVERLLEPWLGPDAAIADLPLPDLVAVTLDPGAAPDFALLESRLQAAAPGAQLDDHRAWISRLDRLGLLVELLTGAIVLLVAGAAALAVVFVTRTGLDIHRQTVDLVHLLGARDQYIARLFERHALAFGFVGGILGLAAAVATISAIGLAVGRLAAGLLPAVTLGLGHWLALAALPLIAGAIAMLTARVTVLRTLAKGP